MGMRIMRPLCLLFLLSAGCQRCGGTAAAPVAVNPAPSDDEACKQVAERYFKALSSSDLKAFESVIGGAFRDTFERTMAAQGAQGLADEMQRQAMSAGIRGVKVVGATRVDPNHYKVRVTLETNKDGQPSAADQTLLVERIDGQWKVTGYGS